jgi:hypothetical protein
MLPAEEMHGDAEPVAHGVRDRSLEACADIGDISFAERTQRLRDCAHRGL